MDRMARVERLRAKRARGERIRVLLVRTSAVGVAYWPEEQPFELPSCQVVAPLGALYLAAVLRAELFDAIDVEVESLSTAVRHTDELASWLAEQRPDVVGLSTLGTERAGATALTSATRQACPEALVVVGGTFPTYLPKECLDWTGADLAVRGEAEAIVGPLFRALLGGADLAAVPGLVLRRGADVRCTAAPPPIEPLDSLPLPAWDLVSLETYSAMYNMAGLPLVKPPCAPILTSRGCPFRCSFCHNFFGRRFRARSADDVLAEMALLQERHGVREFHIVDDLFNFDPARLEAICRGILDRGWDIALALPNGIRGDTLTRDQLKLLARAGCVSLCLSLESASPRIQRLMGKRLDLERLADATRTAADLGIITKLIFMVGYPGETRAEMEQTIRWVRDSACHVCQHSIATPLPGTEMYRQARALDPSFDDAEHGTADYDACRPLPGLSEQELRQVLRDGVAEILSVPERVARVRAVVERWPEAERRYFDPTWLQALGADGASRFVGAPAEAERASGRAAMGPARRHRARLESAVRALRGASALGEGWRLELVGDDVVQVDPPSGPAVRLRVVARDERHRCVARTGRFNLIYEAREQVSAAELGPILTTIVEAFQRVDPPG